MLYNTSIAYKTFNTLRPRQNGRHSTDDIFKCIFLIENAWISIWISLKFVPKGPINNIPALVQIMAWHRPRNKPLSEPMMVRLPTHICVTRPQWAKASSLGMAVGTHCMGCWTYDREAVSSSPPRSETVSEICVAHLFIVSGNRSLGNMHSMRRHLNLRILWHRYDTLMRQGFLKQ